MGNLSGNHSRLAVLRSLFHLQLPQHNTTPLSACWRQLGVAVPPLLPKSKATVAHAKGDPSNTSRHGPWWDVSVTTMGRSLTGAPSLVGIMLLGSLLLA
ncbi:uncharacterized protein LY79DRAFT_547041 [Colletotrichum navitas]|uniref:Uncharacterized protein n=1 Tax=Colletotrichum navitas TaxID=681940 RepID=A0AAD8Q501_9PEZI|nr:uncharacterized protein LY79DRAFT_547041 [Colletotrichum navitas]KAK1595212.1 hypothetical protein LY79DRAFT_547041 [Colletotrichum navitas]